MVQCAVEGCSSRSDTVSVASRMENSVHFHRAPREPHVRKKWMQAINKREIKESTRVCSLHFKKENYYSTKLGFRKLTKGSVPELKLTKEITKDDTTDSSEDDTMSNVQPVKQNICYQSHSQQSSSKGLSLEIRTANNVLRSTSVKHKGEMEEETTDSSEVEEMTDVVNSKKITTNNVTESTIIKPGVQKHIVKTILERKLLKQVRRLQESGKKKMEAIHCLLEQNKRLLERNSFLEKALDNTKKVAENANNVAQQESIFFKFASVTNVSESNG